MKDDSCIEGRLKKKKWDSPLFLSKRKFLQIPAASAHALKLVNKCHDFQTTASVQDLKANDFVFESLKNTFSVFYSPLFLPDLIPAIF